MKDYKLSFFDDFDGKELDCKYWNIVEQEHNYNNEDQYYTKDNYYIENSNLVIVAKKEVKGSKLYTSCRINTQDKVSIQYGRIEVKAIIPLGKGTWPAIWMLGDNVKEVGWPRCGEIDIMEHVGYNKGYINYWLHSGNRNHTVNAQKGGRSYLKNLDQFHVYALEWGKDYLEIYIDDVRIFKINKKADDTVNEWPFDQPFHLIINLAIGGIWGGSRGIDEEIFPSKMLIDYVKIYEIIDNEEIIDIDSQRKFL